MPKRDRSLRLLRKRRRIALQQARLDLDAYCQRWMKFYHLVRREANHGRRNIPCQSAFSQVIQRRPKISRLNLWCCCQRRDQRQGLQRSQKPDEKFDQLRRHSRRVHRKLVLPAKKLILISVRCVRTIQNAGYWFCIVSVKDIWGNCPAIVFREMASDPMLGGSKTRRSP